MPSSQLKPLGFLWRFVRPDRKTVVGIIILLIINNGFSLVEPYLFKIVIDEYLTNIGNHAVFPSTADFTRQLINLLLIWIGVAFISRVAKNFQDFFSTMMADRTGIRVFDHGFSHVLGLSMDYHESKKTGEVMRKLTKAREDVTKLVKVLADKILQNSATILFVLTFSLIKEWRMGVVIATAIPVFVFTTSVIAKKIKALSRSINKEQEGLQGGAVQALDHVAVVKAFGTETYEQKNVHDRNWQANRLLARQTRYWRTLQFVQGTLINFFRTAIVGYGTYLAFQGVMTPGDVIFFTFYAVTIFMPLYELADTFTAYQDGITSIERLQEVLATVPTVPVPLHGQHPTGPGLTIEFQHVDFAYVPDRPILRDVSFTLQPGKKVAVVGGSGGGKSTIAKLLLRYYDVTGGAILVNGVNIKDWDLDALRHRIGTVFQDNILLNDSITANIRYGSFSASDDDVRAAARLANAEEFIGTLNGGYAAIVGERGIKLSGGERQRIAIARAVLKHPDLYIFDEATSSLDSRSEAQVQAAIDHVSSGAASLTIAHRLSTIANADEILVMVAGRVAERGRHTELLSRAGEYAKLYTIQRQQPEPTAKKVPDTDEAGGVAV